MVNKKTIRWLRMGYSGLDFGATYTIEKESKKNIHIIDDFGRIAIFHKRYLGVLFVEVKERQEMESSSVARKIYPVDGCNCPTCDEARHETSTIS